MIDYHLHVVAHDDRPMTVENILQYCKVAKERGIKQLGITEHDRYLEKIDLAAFVEARDQSKDVALRLGIEIDYIPGNEEAMFHVAGALPYDYVIGSVHRVDRREVDRATDQSIYEDYSAYDLYDAYFENVREAAYCGLFEVIGHPDLIKIFRHAPEEDITPMLEKTADAIAEAGVVVDVNAAGLRKPVGEVYPSEKFLAMFREREVPIILSSDAHAAHEVALGYETSVAMVKRVGYESVATFKDRDPADDIIL